MVADVYIATLPFHIAYLALPCVVEEPVLVPAIFVAMDFADGTAEDEDIGLAGCRRDPSLDISPELIVDFGSLPKGTNWEFR